MFLSLPYTAAKKDIDMLRCVFQFLCISSFIFVIPSCSSQHLSLMMDGEIASLAWSPDGQVLAIVPTDGTIQFWDSATNSVTHTINAQTSISSVTWSPDGNRIVSASWSGTDGMINLWDTKTGELTRSTEISNSKSKILAWSPHGSTISVGTTEGAVLLWDADTKDIRTLESQSGNILNVAWSPEGRFLAAGLQNGSIYVWDTIAEELLYILSYSSDNYIADLTWSPDGKTLASASCFSGPASVDNCKLVFWNPSTSEYLWALQSGIYEITAVVWSPNGKLIASALTNGDVILSNPETGYPIRTLRTPIGSTIIAWSPDGQKLAAGSEDGSVLVWKIQ